MINVLNFETAHHYGADLPQLFKCRYNEFVVRHKYNVPVYNGMEYDQYDTPAAVYLIWKDPQEVIRAGMRILPTNRPYMIKDLWPQTVKDIDLPQSPTVWEATRLFIDKSIDENLRHQAHGEILCALLEFGMQYNITEYIATAPPNLWKYTFRRCGWPASPIGDITDIGYSENIQTCIMEVSESVLANVRSTMNVHASVLSQANMVRDKNILIDMQALKQWVCLPKRDSVGQHKNNDAASTNDLIL